MDPIHSTYRAKKYTKVQKKKRKEKKRKRSADRQPHRHRTRHHTSTYSSRVSSSSATAWTAHKARHSCSSPARHNATPPAQGGRYKGNEESPPAPHTAAHGRTTPHHHRTNLQRLCALLHSHNIFLVRSIEVLCSILHKKNRPFILGCAKLPPPKQAQITRKRTEPTSKIGDRQGPLELSIINIVLAFSPNNHVRSNRVEEERKYPPPLHRLADRCGRGNFAPHRTDMTDAIYMLPVRRGAGAA